MFGTLGGPELFLIFVVALIVFGPRKLPEIGKSLGKMMSEFRRASNDFRSTIESEVESEKIRESMRIEPPKVEKVDKATSAAPGTGSDSEEGATAEGAASAEDSPEPGGEPTSDESAASAEPAPMTDPDGEPVPSTVSRQPPAIEPK
ncbi:MAG: twin-arginine translocase TatA/TatE family subunit [Acidobacteria bacterium]|jgi:Tat protein translocase TatB subunit|nr:twin-arginine translocase TatA/TatE family subunit [Acidobacteriota bacterium]